tara:strand:+ start:24495 stop:24722 length:228 start_codon:yes stop_codon:yes gene_type:complete
MSKESYFKNTEKSERAKPLGSTGINEAIEEQSKTREDALIANTKNIYERVAPQNDNSQLNKYLFPPFSDDRKGMA